MSSPVNIAFNDLIKIDRRKKDAIYLQIVFQFINAIQRRYLTEGMLIHGSRVISKQLKVHRKTVIAALEELQAQGWIEIRPNIGTFVKNPQKKKTHPSNNYHKIDSFSVNAKFEFKKSFILNSPFEENESQFQFNDGQPDFRLCNVNEIARFYSNSLKRKKVAQQFSNYSVRGNLFFKEQLSYFLNISRGFHINIENLTIAKSKEMLIFVLTQLLVKQNDTVLIGSFGYFFTNMILRQAGAKVISIPVDKEGIDVDYIKTHFKPGAIRCLFINTRNHYPTTVALSSERKNKLLQLSEKLGFIIIEEDEDFDFCYETSITMPMMSNNNGNVIYIGSVAKFLVPNFQRTFLVASKDFCQEVDKYLGIIDTQGDIVVEQALGEIIKEGDMHRYLRKSLKMYEKRRLYFHQLLTKKMGLDVQIPSGGLAFWVQFNQAFSLTQLAQKCLEQNLFIPRICMYQNANVTALRLGFGHFSEKEMEAGLNILQTQIDT